MFVFGMIAGTTPTTRYESQAGATGPQASFASSDWRFGNASHNAGSSGIPWASIGNILTEDSQYAWVQASNWDEQDSQYAVADGFGFNIPSDMVITGIQVSLKGYVYAPRGGAASETCWIEKGGVIAGQCRPSSFGWSNGWVTVGGPTDKWGLSWSVSDINSNNFGAGVLALLSPSRNAVRVYLDCIKIMVYYDYGPTIDHPSDIYYYEGNTSNSITWHVSDPNPATYTVTKDGVNVQSGTWNGSPITQNVDNLTYGYYNYKCTVYDTISQQQASDDVLVTVNDNGPMIDHPSDVYHYEGTTEQSITWQTYDNHPSTYVVTKDGVNVQSGTWNGGWITQSIPDNLQGGNYTYTCTVYDTHNQQASDDVLVTVNPITKYAIIVGIVDYKSSEYSNALYCDNDANDWYYQFVTNLGWSSSNVKVYGDLNTADYVKYDGLATEYNIKQALNSLVLTADSNDIIAFVYSGHGGGDWLGSSYLCMWDSKSGENGQNGDLYDTELQAILQTSVADRIFVFLMACLSGGFGPDLMDMGNSARVYCTTASHYDSLCYSDPSSENSWWTYCFLEKSWQYVYYGEEPSMEQIFAWAIYYYPYYYGDGSNAQQFDGNPSAPFSLYP